LIGLNSLFQKLPIFIKNNKKDEKIKKRTFQPADAIEDTVLSNGLELSNLKPGCSFSALNLLVG
jgi:hypothetical protein